MKIFVVLIALLLAGCAAFEEGEQPIGTGGGRDEFPRSPCACAEPFYKAGKHV